MLNSLIKELQEASNPEQAKLLQRYFKTGPGEYGEGDIFLGIKVPVTRSIALKYSGMNLKNIEILLKSKIHEYRFAALEILVDKFKKSEDKTRGDIVNFYLKNTRYINNWDLVDTSAPYIIGEFLIDKKRDILYKLAESKDLWEKRISIISTFAFIRESDFKDSLRLAEILLGDSHDLIHKAVGWVLREVGKKDESVLKDFLKKHHKDMPRTTLRYAIERFDEDERKRYLEGKIN
jgi:3-methyladenine DNA glycosylase AlkD